MPTGLVGGNGGQVTRLTRLAFHQVGQPRHALNHIVVSGSARIRSGEKTQQTGVHQPRMALAQRLGVDAQRRQLLRAHAVHEDIGRSHQSLQRLLRLCLLEVERQTFLAAVGAHEHGGHARLQPRAGVAG